MKNTASNTVFSIYLLYPIDRDDGDNFYRLLQNYINIGTEIQAYLLDWEKMDLIDDNTPFPKFYLYVPADHELFIHHAYSNEFLTKKQISLTNCDIIKECNLLILFGDYKPPTDIAILKELQYAKQEKIPIYSMPDLSPHAIQALKFAIKVILKSDDSTED